MHKTSFQQGLRFFGTTVVLRLDAPVSLDDGINLSFTYGSDSPFGSIDSKFLPCCTKNSRKSVFRCFLRQLKESMLGYLRTIGSRIFHVFSLRIWPQTIENAAVYCTRSLVKWSKVTTIDGMDKFKMF